MKTKLLFIQSLSPLHSGTGQGIGVIDQPIAREKATNIPYLPGSSIKGVLRAACTDLKCDVDAIFGPEPDKDDAYAGSVNFSDARLLMLPVRSLSGIFAWVTCPFILQRFKRDLQDIAFSSNPPDIVPAVEIKNCLVSEVSSPLNIDGESMTVVLEDLKLSALTSNDLQVWAEWLGQLIFPEDAYWQNFFKDRLCLVSDDVLSFLLEIGTEVTARIRIDKDTKTVAQGALWYEESLPAETILSSLVVASNIKATPKDVFKAISSITEKTIQFGGSATVGRGLCSTVLVPKEAA